MKDIFLFIKKNNFNLLIILLLVFGILLRLKGFLYNPSFWHDECALGWNIKALGYGELFGTLKFLQMAPPFCLIFTKAVTQIVGFSDFSLRIIPFIASFLSLFSFYFLAKTFLNKKSSLFLAVFLFCINYELINYAYELKFYGVDVLLTILSIIFFVKVDFEKYTLKKLFIYGSIMSLCPWFSFVSVFTIAGGFVYLFFKDIKKHWQKKIMFFIPTLFSGIVILIVMFEKNKNFGGMANYWSNSFLTSDNFFVLIRNALDYYFYPASAVLFALIFIVWGIILLYKKKGRVVNLLVFPVVFCFIFSILKIYPFADRLILFLLPVFIIFVVAPIEIIGKKRIIQSVFIVFANFLLFFPQVTNLYDYISNQNLERGENPREAMKILAENIKPQDKIVINRASDTEFAYYSLFYNLKNEMIRDNVTGLGKEEYLKFLNNLKKGKYWFFLSFEYSGKEVIPYVLEWINTQDVSFYKKINSSYVFCVEKK